MEVYGIAQILPVARVGEGDQSVEAGGRDVKHVEASARLRIRLYITRPLAGGPSGRLLALRACSTSSFTPLGRSGRVTSAILG